MKIRRATGRHTSCHVPHGKKAICGQRAAYWIQTHTGLDDPDRATVDVPMCEGHAAFFASEKRLEEARRKSAKRATKKAKVAA